MKNTCFFAPVHWINELNNRVEKSIESRAQKYTSGSCPLWSVAKLYTFHLYNGPDHLESKARQYVFALLQMRLSQRSFQRVASQAAPCHDWVTTWRPWVGSLIRPCRIHLFGWHGSFYTACVDSDFLPPLNRQIVFFPNRLQQITKLISFIVFHDFFYCS